MILEYLDTHTDELVNGFLSAFITSNKQSVQGFRSMFDILWWESELREKEEKERAALELSYEDLKLVMENETQRRRLFALLQDILTHDLRNFNQVAKLSAELLAEEAKKDSNIRMFADSLLGAVDGSTRLIQQANRLGEILSKKRVNLQPLGVCDVIHASLESVEQNNLDRVVRHNLMVNGARFTREGKENNPGPKVLADDLLSDVFENIYLNAIENTPSKEVPIETRIETEDHYCKISIVDNGRGMPEDSKKQILIRSRQITKRTGIGLSIVNALVVERYGGTVELTNRVPNDYAQGAQIELRLQIPCS
ncbi:MAG TPA: HAMP domain-containing sensor histidine kinase [Nitrososphaerales archaeon]|nr:HAMP domain-containing sensor histidine kinase [Nitrososphaerales archaeon]